MRSPHVRRTARRRFPAPVFVYLITDDRGHTKIGIAERPEGRRAHLQVGNPYPLRVAQTWKFSDAATAYAVEQLLLSRAVRHRTSGEWVRCRLGALIRLASRHAETVISGEKIQNVSKLEIWGMGAAGEAVAEPTPYRSSL